MPATDYRIMQIPNWKAGWDTVAPVVLSGIERLQSVLLHTHNISQSPTNIRVFQGWLVVTMNDRLDAALEQHLGITPN